MIDEKPIIQRILKENISTIVLVGVVVFFAYVNQKQVHVLIESQSIIDRNTNIIDRLNATQERIEKDDKEFQKEAIENQKIIIDLLKQQKYYYEKSRAN